MRCGVAFEDDGVAAGLPSASVSWFFSGFLRVEIGIDLEGPQIVAIGVGLLIKPVDLGFFGRLAGRVDTLTEFVPQKADTFLHSAEARS